MRILNIDSILKNGIKEIIANNSPVIINAHNLIKVQNVDEIISVIGNQEFTVLNRPKNAPNEIERKNTERITLSDFYAQERFIDTKEEQFLVCNFKKNASIASKLVDHEFISLFRKLRAINIWVNTQNDFTGAHFDAEDNFNIQLLGKKRFVLYNPGIIGYKTQNFWHGKGHLSQISNFEEVDIIKHPSFQKILTTKVEIVLNPGQILFLPSGWWHNVHSLDALNINLNFWFFSYNLFKNPYILMDNLYKDLYRKVTKQFNY